VRLYEKIIMSLAYKLIDKRGGRIRHNDVWIIRMSDDFKKWVYSDGYTAWRKAKGEA
jgi:hypothetical protein